MRVLVADDNEVSLTLMEAVLTQAGYSVDTARDGAEALVKVREGGARLVVTDWEMPGMSGVELCRAVRTLDLPGYVYVLLVTSHDNAAHTVEGLTAGADDFVGKPFDPGVFLARVRTGVRILSLETRDMAIFAMAKLAESRDPETGAHLERVRCYCRELARELSRTPRYAGVVDEAFVHLMYLTSPLHDIGKVGIPDTVLLKPGRLSDNEFEIMKTHTTLGAQTLEAALRAFPGVKFLELARDIAISHHERWDGTGYPLGLKGEEIPLAGRIVAIADVYDALTSKRVYKPAVGHELAMTMIEGGAGTHFDPEMVRAFARIGARCIAIRERYDESLPMAA
jgi:putative two-component system response regulator